MQPVILTIVRKEKFYCITKEKYEKFHEDGAKISLLKVKKSVGDDLDEFCAKIEERKLVDNDIGPNGRGNLTFDLSLLTAKQKKYITNQELYRRDVKDYKVYQARIKKQNKDLEDFLEMYFYHNSFHYQHGRHDVPQAEKAQSKSNSIYCAALCCRCTYIVHPELTGTQN